MRAQLTRISLLRHLQLCFKPFFDVLDLGNPGIMRVQKLEQIEESPGRGFKCLDIPLDIAEEFFEILTIIF